MQPVDGFEIPIHRSLTEPILLSGAPRRLAILNATMTAALGLGFQSWFAIPVGILIHTIAVMAAKVDPHFFDILLRHIKEKSTYYL